MPDFRTNQIPIAFPQTATVTGHFQASRLRLPAVAGTKRASSFLDTPTFTESGVPGTISPNQFGIMGPPKLPKAITQRVAQETIKVIRLPTISDRLVKAGIESFPGSAADFRQLLHSECARCGKVVKTAACSPPSSLPDLPPPRKCSGG